MLRPLGDRLVVKRDDPKKESKGGIVLPDTVQEKPVQGEVLAVGLGKFSDQQDRYIAIDVGVGDHVLFSTYSGTDVEHDGEKLVILREEDVLAVVDS